MRKFVSLVQRGSFVNTSAWNNTYNKWMPAIVYNITIR